MQNVKVHSKTTKTGLSMPSRWELFSSVTQHYSYQRQMFRWLLERLAINYFEIFESLNFETVQNVKIGSQRRD